MGPVDRDDACRPQLAEVRTVRGGDLITIAEPYR
jgi:hypothetical protein